MLRLKLNGDRGDFEQLVGGLGYISGVEGILSAFTPDRAGFIFNTLGRFKEVRI